MAKDNSFDIVSEVDLAEVANAVNQAGKEVAQRYDFKGTGSTIELDTKDGTLTLRSASEYTLETLAGIVEQRLIRRKVSPKALSWGAVEPAAKDTVRQTATIQSGIPIEKAREIVKYVKDLKLKKVQIAIQGEQLRVSGRDRDALQEAIAALREHDFDVDMQFTNYR
jgi:uncharacterized protein YajQ (UPF0234 family)